MSDQTPHSNRLHDGSSNVCLDSDPVGEKEPTPVVDQEFPLKGPYMFQPKTNGDHWEQSLKAVEKYDNDMCKSWREEIDTLLVFAGLFTAIVTAFTVESYRWLRRDPVDVSNELLIMVLQQQRSNVTSPFNPITLKEFTPTNSAIRINCLWFLSITISLTAGVTGILCKQWMREFQRDAALPAKDALALRQLRLLGWERWGVPQFISLPAILLQTSVLFFFAGLLDLLCNEVRCYPVAICATAVIACTATSMGLTTVLPTLYILSQHGVEVENGPSYQCPYKSPQSYLCLKLASLGSCGFRLFSVSEPHLFKSGWVCMDRLMLNRCVYACGSTRTTLASTRYISLLLTWMKDNLAYSKHVRNNLLHCMQDSQFSCSSSARRSHIVLWETQKQCAGDLFPDEMLCSLVDEKDNPIFHLEVALRTHMSQMCLPDQVFHQINMLRHVTVPNILAKQVFWYARHCMTARDRRKAGSFCCMWTAILNLCVAAPAFDNDFIELLYHYARRTCSSRSRIERPDPFVTAMAYVVKDRKEFFQSISHRRIFVPLMTMVRTAHCHLGYPNTRADWEFVTSTVKAQTSLDPSFFDGHSFQDGPSDLRTPCIPIPSSSGLIDQFQNHFKFLPQLSEAAAA